MALFTLSKLFVLFFLALAIAPSSSQDVSESVPLEHNYARQDQKPSLTVIWQADPEDERKAVEGDWMHRVVLHDLTYTEIVDTEFKVFVDNAVLIFSAAAPSDALRLYLQTYSQRGLKFSLIHFSDEYYFADPSRTLYSCAKVAFRNYYHDVYALQPNVAFLPLGFTQGAYRQTDVVKPVRDRTFVWAFVGQISHKPSREQMRDAFLTVDSTRYYTHETNTWGRFDPVSMNATQMGTILADAILCPSPRGWWNKDSFRWTEALEFGCIPIVEDDEEHGEPRCDNHQACRHNQPNYFGNLLGAQPPFPRVALWADAPPLMRQLLASPAQLQALQDQCLAWYAAYKRALAQRVASLLLA